MHVKNTQTDNSILASPWIPVFIGNNKLPFQNNFRLDFHFAAGARKNVNIHASANIVHLSSIAPFSLSVDPPFAVGCNGGFKVH